MKHIYAKGDEETCDKCKFYIAVCDGDEEGNCRRYPPSIVYANDRSAYIYPRVDSDGWCGEFKAKT